MGVTRYSRQREAIRDYLLSTTSHPTAESVYKEIRKDFPKISLGTVYRNLNLLVSQGKALRLSIGDGNDRFDGNIHPHNHFFCKNCGRLMDLEMDPIDHINLIANAGFDGEVQGHSIYFYGFCKDCKKGDCKKI